MSNSVRRLHGLPDRPLDPSPPKSFEVAIPEMSSEARAYWDRTAAPLIKAGLIDEWSAAPYARLCWFRVQAEKLRALIDEEGPVVKGARSGDLVRHPVWTPLRQLDAEIARLELRFGIAPADRSRVDADLGEPYDEDDDLLTSPYRDPSRLFELKGHLHVTQMDDLVRTLASTSPQDRTSKFAPLVPEPADDGDEVAAGDPPPPAMDDLIRGLASRKTAIENEGEAPMSAADHEIEEGN